MPEATTVKLAVVLLHTVCAVGCVLIAGTELTASVTFCANDCEQPVLGMVIPVICRVCPLLAAVKAVVVKLAVVPEATMPLDAIALPPLIVYVKLKVLPETRPVRLITAPAPAQGVDVCVAPLSVGAGLVLTVTGLIVIAHPLVVLVATML